MVVAILVVAMGVHLNGRRWIAGSLAFACAVLCGERAAARTVDPSGSVVVCTEAAFRAAADELALHLKLITGEAIPVARAPGSAYNWFVGTAPDDDRGPFAPEEGRWRASEDAAWFYGDTNVNRQAAAKTGVDMAVHAFLEDELGCRWPWADKVSVVEQNPIRLKNGSGAWKPPFRLRTIRAGKPGALWQARLRDGRHDLPPYYHAFTGYWKDYGKEHPEYFAMRKDGKRLPPGAPSDRDDPAVYAGNMGRAISMCVSCEGLVDRIVENWRKDGAGPFINICENDAVGQNRCWCPDCSALDEPQPPAAHPQRFGWFADRYVRFGNRVLEKARRIRPDVRVIYYGYNASEIAPRREKVAKGSLLGLVPIFFTPERMAKYIGDWKAAGADEFFYRPNRHHYFKSAAIPLGNEEYFFDIFKQVAAANPIGFDYDATGKTDVMAYFRDYVIYKGMQDPSKDFAHWENHYCQAFGAAKDDVRDYFRLWRGVWKAKLEPRVADWTKTNPDFGRPFSTHLPEFYKIADVDRGIALLERGLARPGLTVNHRALVRELREAQDETRLLVRAATDRTDASARALLDWRRAHGKELVPFGESYYDDFTGVVGYIRKNHPDWLAALPKHVTFYAERREKEAKGAVSCELDTGCAIPVWDTRSAEPPGLKVVNRDRVAHKVSVTAKVADLKGGVLFDGTETWTLDGGKTARLAFPKPPSNGIYEVTYAVTNDGREVLRCAGKDVRFAAMKPAGPFAEKHDLDPRHFLFGVCAHPLRHPVDVQRKAVLAAALCGARHLRGSLSWGEHNPKPGVFDWRKSDAFMDIMDEYRLQWQTHFGYTPRWAVAADAEARRTSAPTAKKRGMPLPDLKAYADYVRALATHYRGRFRIYEAWNEPDINWFADFPIADYIEMQKICYRTVKAIDPRAIVETAGFANSHAEPWIDALLKEAPDSFDYLAWHGHCPFGQYLSGVGMVKTLLHKHGIRKPWIANETALSDPDEHVLAQNLPQKIVYSWANGACGYAWFRLFNNEKRKDGSESHFALMSSDFNPKEPYLAYNMLAELLTDAHYVGEPGFAGDLWCYRFETKDAALLAMWDCSGLYEKRELVVETDARTATLVDLVGNERTLRIDRGRVTLSVGVDFETLKLAPARAKIRLVRENAARKPRETAVIAGDSTAAWQPAFSCGGRDRVKVLVPSEPSKAHLVWAGNNDLSFNVKIRPGLGSGVLQMMVTVRDDVHANGSSGRLLYRGDSVQVRFLFPSQRENWEIFAAEKDDGTRETFVWQAPSGVDKAASNGKIRLNTAHFSSKGRNFLQYALTFPLTVLGVTETDLTEGFAMNVTVNDDDGEGRESMMTFAGEHDSSPDRWPLVRFEKGAGVR